MDEPLNLAKAPSINKPRSRRLWRALAGFDISLERLSVVGGGGGLGGGGESGGESLARARLGLMRGGERDGDCRLIARTPSIQM